MNIQPRAFLAELYRQAVKAADPYGGIVRHLPSPPKGRTVVIAIGKAAGTMMAAFEGAWDGPFEGLVVAPHGTAVRCKSTDVYLSAHPVPDRHGLTASAAVLNRLIGLTRDDLAIFLISGGGSALLPAPPPEFTLDDEIDLNRKLLGSGAPISAMNVIRKHFSRVKGGRLAARAHPAKVVTLVVSDVPGDNPSFVSSGPTVPEASSGDDAMGLIRDYRIALDERVLQHTAADKPPRPDDPEFYSDEVQVIASASLSLKAAAHYARSTGVTPLILSDNIEGEAKDIGRMHAALVREFSRSGLMQPPFVLLSGGETTVTIGHGSVGKGGRNTEFVLSAAIDLDGHGSVTALAADTDGIDGSEDNAGAYCDGTTIARIRSAGSDARSYLLGHDSWSAFHEIGDLFVTGPTGTNVNDFRAFLVTELEPDTSSPYISAAPSQRFDEG